MHIPDGYLDEALAQMGIAHIADRAPFELSSVEEAHEV